MIITLSQCNRGKIYTNVYNKDKGTRLYKRFKKRKQGRNVSCRACFYFHRIVEGGLDEMS